MHPNELHETILFFLSFSNSKNKIDLIEMCEREKFSKCADELKFIEIVCQKHLFGESKICISAI